MDTYNRVKYSYDGPVTCFGRYISWFKGETMAETPRKAKSNLIYQFKNKYGLGIGQRIEFPNTVKEV